VEVTLDSIKGIKIFQPKNGYRFSVDALLLENFISAKHLRKGVEFGTGCGIISILLAKRYKNLKILAVEIQKSLAECAIENIKLNGLEDKIKIIIEDVRNLKGVFPANKFDFVFSNPPFRKTKTGLISIDEGRAVARHEIKISLPGLINTASYLLKNTGKFYLIYHPFRLIEVIGLLQKAGLEPKRMRFVHSRRVESPTQNGGQAKMVLIEAVKGSGAWLKIEPAFYIYEKGREYTAEMKTIYI
jgi:tRNA1Val (adenine37-N6)-methyltransferase